MFKRIVFLSLMLITSLGCIAQDHLYITPVIDSRFDFGDTYNVHEATVNFQHYKQITERSWTRFSYGIGARIGNGDWSPIIGVSYGVGIDFDNFYTSIDFKPMFKSLVREIVFGVVPRLGVGYNFSVSECTTIFIETGIYKEFDIIYTNDKVNINSFGIYLNIGFRFKHI